MSFISKFINSYSYPIAKKYSLNIFVITDKYNTIAIIWIIGIAILLLLKMINFVVCINKN